MATNSLLPADKFADQEVFTDSLDHLSDYSKEFYGPWITRLRQGRTIFFLHWNYDPKRLNIPDDYDTYVFTHHFEQWDHAWLEDFCDNHPHQSIIMVTEYPLSPGYMQKPNLKVLVYHWWDFVIQKVLAYTSDCQYKSLWDRQHRMSLLINKRSFYKAFAMAYIKKFYPDSDVIMSWNTDPGVCGSMDFFKKNDLPKSPDIFGELVEYYEHHLANLTLKLDDWINDPFRNYYWNIPAYTDCLINVAAETFHQSKINDQIMPGPFVTEKSWKCLLSGAAFLPNGSHGRYRYFQQFGFQFDYPWDRSFDDNVHDFPRLLDFFKQIDAVMAADIDDLKRQLQPSSEFNFQHIRSSRFSKAVDNLNQASLERFLHDR